MQTLLRAVSRRGVRLSSTRTNVAASLLPTLEDKIYDAVVKKDSVSWNDLRETEFPRLVREHFSQIDRASGFSGQSFASMVIRSLAKNEKSGLLRDFVQHHGLDNLSVPLVALYIRHCGKADVILNTWQYLKKRNGTLFDGNSTVYLVDGLCKTDQWRDAITLIHSISEVGKPPVAAMRRVVQKLFEERRIDEAIEWCNQLYSTEPVSPGLECEPALATLNTADRLLEMIASMQLQISKDLISSPGWHPLFDVKLVSIIRPSVCPNCRTSLMSPRKFLSGELEQLRELVRTRLLRKESNIFQTTTPKEFAQFESFIKQQGPFDVILDGLNIGYRLGESRVAEEARRIVNQEGKRVLIIGRIHMRGWPGMKRLPRDVRVYTTQDLSRDDPFMFLACLYSHPRCTIVTSDHFRDHKFTLGLSSVKSRSGLKDQERPDMQAVRLFSLWLNTRHRQIGCTPLQHDIVAQKDRGGWHIPMFRKLEEVQGQLDHDRWACVRYR